MLMTRWQPANLWSEMRQFQNEVNRLFDSFGGSWPVLAPAYPAINIWEDQECVYAEAELPGMELNDLDIFVTGGNQLTITGERKRPAFDGGTWHRQERGFGKFSRVMALPFDVDADNIEAKFAHGVLTIRMPKSERAKPRRITVKAE